MTQKDVWNNEGSPQGLGGFCATPSVAAAPSSAKAVEPLGQAQRREVVARVPRTDEGVRPTAAPSQPSRRQWLGLAATGAAAALGYSFWPPSRDRQGAVPSPVAIPLPDGRGSMMAMHSAPASPVTARSIGMSFATIPAGTFQMGSPTTEASRSSDETPHRVTLTKPFAMSIHEVTQGQFQQVLKRNPSSFKSVPGMDTGKFPVERVTWFDAIEFCNALSQLEGLSPCYELKNPQRGDEQRITAANVTWLDSGKGYRLPTEAEWEYACRAGTTTPFHFGSQCNGKDANADGNDPYGTTTKGPYLQRTTTVGSYAKNAFGLYDMHGNVWEWCWDWYDATQSPGQDPKGPVSGTGRVLRGGSWSSSPLDCRSSFRVNFQPDLRLSNLGFRVART